MERFGMRQAAFARSCCKNARLMTIPFRIDRRTLVTSMAREITSD
jgi:hypothetical protein